MLCRQPVAPTNEDHVSIRDPLFQDTEHGMVGRMGGLRQETVTKNAEMQRQIVSGC